MDEIRLAHHELDRLQGIITRHEGFMFALRGWLLAIVGGLLAAFYTVNIDMSAFMLGTALFLIFLMFLVVESRHVNLVEAVAERAGEIEKQIRLSRQKQGKPLSELYDGPRVSVTCRDGAYRLWPKNGMTFILNLPFYVIVIVIIVATTVWLPSKQESAPLSVETVQPDSK